MDTQYNKQELLRLRDTYLNAQKEYVEKLNKIPKYKSLLKELQHMPTKDLLLKAASLIAAIEKGEVEEKDLADVELRITLYFDAIQDHVRDKEIAFHPYYQEETPKKKIKKDASKEEPHNENDSTKNEDSPKTEKEEDYEFKIVSPHEALEICPSKKSSKIEPKKKEPEIEI